MEIVLGHICNHHLLKTFWTGTTGWTDRQLPDATILWTAPSGQHHTTKPGSQLFFPRLRINTGPAPTTDPRRDTTHRDTMMPTRPTTREQQRKHHIAAERALNRKARLEGIAAQASVGVDRCL